MRPAIPEVDDQVADALEQSADLIVEYGWCQGTGQDWRGRFCAMGALRHVTLRRFAGNRMRMDHVYNRARAFLVNHFADKEIDPHWVALELTMWNDKPWRRKAGVLEALRAVAGEVRP